MVEVLNPGPDFAGDWEYKTTCGRCQSELLVKPEDIKFGWEGGSYCETGTRCLYFDCPMCGNQPSLPIDFRRAIFHRRPDLKRKWDK